LVPTNKRASPFFAEPDAQPCPAAIHGSSPLHCVRPQFAEPRWNRQSPEWQAIDCTLDGGHLVRIIARFVDEELDLDDLCSSYSGRGSLPHRPDLLLKLVLYEHQIGQPRPARWLKDLEEVIPVRWLTFGIRVSRSTLYEFRDRVRPFVDELLQQVIRTAIDERHTDASTGSLDGTFVAANASRHRLLSLEIVERRLEQLDQAIAETDAVEGQDRGPSDGDETIEIALVAEAAGTQPEIEPNQHRSATSAATHDQPLSFMAKTTRGKKRQRAQYRKAQKTLQQRNELNARRRKDKRKNSKQIRIAIADPMAPYGLDKEKVYRPVYNVQTMSDVRTDLVFAFSVTPTLSDSGHLVPMIDQTIDAAGRPLKVVLADSGYPSGDCLAQCEEKLVEVFAPWNENSFTAGKRAKTGADGPIGKDKFTWNATIPGFCCPQGHSLTYRNRTTKQKANGDSVPLEIYQADPADCAECPLKARCVQGRSGARTVRRQPHEDLIDKMRERMKTPEAKALYLQRSCTVERRFADLKTHRGIERISGQTPQAAETQVGLTILAHNLITLDKLRRRKNAARENPQKVAA
jgi:transposase